jgi:hypothetical protein
MTKRIYLFSVFSVFIFTNLLAQSTIKSFSSDSVKFLAEMTAFFDNANKKDGKDFIEDKFKPVWLKETWDPAKRAYVYKVCNDLLKKRLRPYPEFKNFLMALINFRQNKLSETTWKQWQAAVEKLMEKAKNKDITSFMEASELLFEGSVLFRSNALQWGASSSDYTIEYDSVPKITFKQTDLISVVKNDSAIIFNTSGAYYPTSDNWIGKGGKVTWARVGVDENTIYAEINKYKLKLSKQGYEVDSAVFYNKVYFPKPIIGKLSDKAVPDANANNANYPKFESYSKRFQINGIANGSVDFDGGFNMSGNRFIGSGNKEKKALIVIKRNGKKFMVASSSIFVFKKDRIYSDEAAITMYLDADSIFHPNLKFNFNIDKRDVNLIRTEAGISRAAYSNTFHKVDMYIEEIYWKIDSAYMNMKTLIGSTIGESSFESSNYFRQERFDQFMMQDQISPLTQMKDYVKSIGGTKEFAATDYAKYVKYPIYEIQPTLVKMAVAGFINYDIDGDWIQVKERLYDYSFARVKLKDYDVINIMSKVQGGANNAQMNLLNYDIKIRGVREIFLSDSQNVYIYPEKQEVTLKKNRNFDFGGKVNAGLLEFYGKKFSFEYDKFKINLNDVDSMKMSIKEKGPNGSSRVVKIKTVIEGINGELIIDEMTNRSGIKSDKFPQYPVLKTNKESFVYYDRKNIQKGVYNRDKFYFKLDPFTIDSLDNFQPQGIKLDGDFVSAGILPQIREQLSVQPDYSLGFVRKTGTEGLALYTTKGKFDATVKLSHKGLQGDGTISYLTSTTISKDIMFYPDSINANADSYVVKEQPKGSKTEYPPVKGDTVYVHWVPKKDVMQVFSKDKPLDMFAGKLKLNGHINYKPTTMTGSGKTEFAGAEMQSYHYTFKNQKFSADTANFRLKALEQSLYAFSTYNVNATIDFEKKEGSFKSNGKGSIVSFDVNKYICYMDEFKWQMDDNTIEVSSNTKTKSNNPGELDFTGPEFISVHPKQDSLRFFAQKAKFDIKNFIISAKSVKYINVADARVYPDSGNVTVLKDAVMKTLNNAEIVANSVTKYHKIYGSTVNVFGRKSYTANGKYDYVDELKKKQTIFFSNISVDTSIQTYADAVIADTSHFMLSPNYEYYGKVFLRSTDQFLTFEGSCMMQHACNTIPKGWFMFKSQINPNQIYIPVGKEVYDKDGKSFAASIMSTTDSNQVYTAFLSKIISKNDIQVVPAEGYLYFDKPSREYRIASKEKLVERSLNGNFLSLNANKCIVYGEGKLNLGTDLGQVKTLTVGNATHNTNNDSAYFDLMILLDFFFDDGALDKMADVINAKTDLPATNFGRPTYEKGLREIVGKEKADKLISEVNLYGKFKKFPDELERSMFITDLKMRWDPKSKSYISSGKIGIGNIRKNQINKMVDGWVQLKRKRGGDEINIYLEIEPGTWYFFSYTNGIMQAISSKEDFNTILKELKPEKRQQEVPKGEKPYQFSSASETKKDLFVKKMKQANQSDD